MIFHPARGKVFQRSSSDALTGVQIIFKGSRCHTRELQLLLSQLLLNPLCLFDPCQLWFGMCLTCISVSFSFSHSRNGLRRSVWIRLLSASKSASCTSRRASSPFPASPCSLTWPLIMLLSHLWRTRWSRRPRVASRDISRASLDSKVNQDLLRNRGFILHWRKSSKRF